MSGQLGRKAVTALSRAAEYNTTHFIVGRQMNVYQNFFLGMNPDEWEFFALDFLSSLGYTIERYPSRGSDGGRDGLVSWNGKIYLVSCKHYAFSDRAVGVNDEHSILDRVIQHGATGFIGVYSTLLSTGLDERFTQLTNSGHECIVYDANRISSYLPTISSHVLQKYGLPKGISYPLHVHPSDYRPLCCLGCGVDILQEDLIRISMGLVCLDAQGNLEYLYGCKRCLGNIDDLGWVDLYQALHQEEINRWITYVNEALEMHAPSLTFYKHKSDFEGGIQQRMFPPNWGRWFSI